MKTSADIFLAEAAREARKGMTRRDGGPFGAVIVRNGRIIARGHNTVLRTQNPTRHAEINAIGAACRKMGRFSLDGCDVYSTTEPCPMCFAAIHWARCRTIFYSTVIADVKKLGFNELAVSNQQMKRIGRSAVRLVRWEHAECRDLLRAWANLPRKSVY